jgi:hypothetical protein
MPKKVYTILSSDQHDLTPAEEFGEVVSIQFRDTNGRLLSRLQIQESIDIIEEALSDSTPEDFIIISSPALFISLLTGVFSDIHGSMNLLLYEGGQYRVRSVQYATDDTTVG